MLLGVTGTNGKTTTAHLLERGLAMAGHTTGLLGTIETRIGDEVLPAGRTTPEAPDLQALLAVMVERGVTAAAMEVSSHALALGRVDGTWYTAGLFTNLGTDHLDFHGSPERYFAAKAELFRPDRCARAVVNVDDPAGRRLAAAPRVPTTTVSLAGRDGADWRARVLVRGDGTTVRVLGPDGLDRELRLGLAGAVNAANGLLALAGLVAVGVPVDAAAQGIGSLAHVPGRVERVHAGQPFAAFVDYAHTPEAVAALLSDLRASTRGRLVVVIGCGGERDAAKRPLMATAAVQGADLAVLTSDNPRGEDPDQILAEMTAGLPPGGWIAERDRRAAIRLAVSGLRAGDTVVVAGKGHETGQEIGGRVLPFDDRSVLVEALASAAVAPAGSGSVP